MKKFMVLAVLVWVLFSSCASDPYWRYEQERSGAIGAVSGAVAGALLSPDNPVAGAVIGAGAGAALGVASTPPPGSCGSDTSYYERYRYRRRTHGRYPSAEARAYWEERERIADQEARDLRRAREARGRARAREDTGYYGR